MTLATWHEWQGSWWFPPQPAPRARANIMWWGSLLHCRPWVEGQTHHRPAVVWFHWQLRYAYIQLFNVRHVPTAKSHNFHTPTSAGSVASPANIIKWRGPDDSDVLPTPPRDLSFQRNCSLPPSMARVTRTPTSVNPSLWIMPPHLCERQVFARAADSHAHRRQMLRN